MSAYTQVLTQMSAYAQGCPVYVWESCELNVQHYVSPTLGRALLVAMLNYIPLVSKLEELLLVLSNHSLALWWLLIQHLIHHLDS